MNVNGIRSGSEPYDYVSFRVFVCFKYGIQEAELEIRRIEGQKRRPWEDEQIEKDVDRREKRIKPV